MASTRDESAMFRSWFRALSLTYLSKALGSSCVGNFNWIFLRYPGLQFWYDIRDNA